MILGLTGIAALEAEMRDRLADKNAEIERLRHEGNRFADWIEELYGSLPTDLAPGPPKTLLAEMRRAFAT